MKTIILLGFFLLAFSAYGENGDLFRPFREGKSNYVEAKDLRRAEKELKENQKRILENIQDLLISIEESPSAWTYRDLINSLEDIYLEELGEKEVRRDTQKKNLHRHVLNLLRGQELIDDTLHRLVNDAVNFEYPAPNKNKNIKPKNAAIPLTDYLTKKKTLIRYHASLAKVKDEEVSSESLSPFPLKNFKYTVNGYRELSLLDRIFYLYTPSQIKEMALILDFALNVADARKVFTTIEFRDGEEPLVLTHSPTEQYRLALRLMRMQKEEAERNPTKIGTYIKDIDLIASAYVLGIISYDELSLIVNNPDFYLPEVSFAKKVVRYLGDLSLLAVRVHPATAPYALIPLLLYNAYTETQNAKNKIDEDAFIFSLPERGR